MNAARDARLALARRIDWRFLLPEPRLASVALLGGGDTELLAALRAFAGSVTVLPRNHLPESAGRFDTVVTASPVPASAAGALRLLRPGGALYWEIDRGHRPGGDASGNRRPRLLEEISASLRAAGAEDLRVHWHHPDFAACREIVPLRDDQVVAHLLRRSAPGVRGKLRAAGGRFLRLVHRMDVLAPCVSVTCRPGSARRCDR